MLVETLAALASAVHYGLLVRAAAADGLPGDVVVVVARLALTLGKGRALCMVALVRLLDTLVLSPIACLTQVLGVVLLEDQAVFALNKSGRTW